MTPGDKSSLLDNTISANALKLLHCLLTVVQDEAGKSSESHISILFHTFKSSNVALPHV